MIKHRIYPTTFDYDLASWVDLLETTVRGIRDQRGSEEKWRKKSLMKLLRQELEWMIHMVDEEEGEIQVKKSLTNDGGALSDYSPTYSINVRSRPRRAFNNSG